MVELTSSATYRHGSRSGRPPFARRFWPFHHRQRIRLWGMAFVLPTLLFFAVFKYGPMVWAIELSFNSYDMVSQPHFVGLDNYRALAADPPLPRAPSGHARLGRGGDRDEPVLRAGGSWLHPAPRR